MVQSLITPSVIAREALFHLENNLVFGGIAYKQYRNEFVKIGDSLTIRRPVKFAVSDGATRVNQDVIEETTSIVINQRKHVSWLFSSQDLTLTVYEYADRYIKPAMIQLANQIDADLAQETAQAFYQQIIAGTDGTIGGGTAADPERFRDLRFLAARMDNLSVPDDGNRCLILDPDARWGLADGLGTTNNQSIFDSEIVGPMVRRGYLGELAGLHIYGNQNIRRQQVGARGNTASVGLVNGVLANTVNAANPTGGIAAIPFDAANVISDAQYFRTGEVIHLAGVNAVNPVTRQTLPFPAEFVVTADVATTASAGTIPISPAIVGPNVTGALGYQNVSALPADNAQIFLKGQTAVPAAGISAAANQFANEAVAFHKNALALVTVPLELPDSVTFKARAEWNGYSIRVIKDYDIENDREIIRLDVLYGVKAIYPDLGVRLRGLPAAA